MEKYFRACGSMEAIRKLPPVLKEAWAKSMGSVVKSVAKHFNHLICSGQQVHICESATNEGIKSFMESAAVIDPAIDTSILAPKQDDLKNMPCLRDFLTIHCRICHYSFHSR